MKEGKSVGEETIPWYRRELGPRPTQEEIARKTVGVVLSQIPLFIATALFMKPGESRTGILIGVPFCCVGLLACYAISRRLAKGEE